MKKSIAFFLIAVLTALFFVPYASAADAEGTRSRTEYFFDLQAKFAALSDVQKKEIYKLNEKLTEQSKKLISKYVEYGIVDEPHGKTLCRMLDDSLVQARKDGKLLLGVVPPLPAA